MGLGGIYALQGLFCSSPASPYPSHFTSKPTEEERRESDEKSKAVVAVSEEGEGWAFAAGSDEGDRQRVTFAEKRIISLQPERVRIKEGDGVNVGIFSLKELSVNIS